MAGKTRFDMAVEALKPYDGQTLSVGNLKLLIMRNLASTEPAVRGYCRMLEACGITTEVEMNKFKIDTKNDRLRPQKDVDHFRTEEEVKTKDEEL